MEVGSIYKVMPNMYELTSWLVAKWVVICNDLRLWMSMCCLVYVNISENCSSVWIIA